MSPSREPLFALQDQRLTCPLAPGMSPAIDAPGGDGTDATHKHENVDEQENKIEIVECFHALRFCKIRASPVGGQPDAASAASVIGRMKPLIYGYQCVTRKSLTDG